mmetsp:Transcript_4336/g.17418  ORF Transcript_4336/g.17418 Transcript_4336/m.17418 type:complete len:237 (+) Transcript_4336:210-920(+)
MTTTSAPRLAGPRAVFALGPAPPPKPSVLTASPAPSTPGATRSSSEASSSMTITPCALLPGPLPPLLAPPLPLLPLLAPAARPRLAVPLCGPTLVRTRAALPLLSSSSSSTREMISAVGLSAGHQALSLQRFCAAAAAAARASAGLVSDGPAALLPPAPALPSFCPPLVIIFCARARASAALAASAREGAFPERVPPRAPEERPPNAPPICPPLPSPVIFCAISCSHSAVISSRSL